MVINLVLFAVKLYIGLRTASLCIYTDSMNNLGDVIACALAFFGVLLMRKPASKSFPMGFGRAEDIAGLVMAAIISLTGCYFAYTALERLFYPRPVAFMLRFAVIIFITMLIKLIMGIVFRQLGKKTPSVVLKTLSMDSFADAGVTAMSLISFALAECSGLRADALFGLAISAVIITNGIKLLISTVSLLSGKTDLEIEERVKAYFGSAEGAEKISQIMVHSYGEKKSITAVVRGGAEINEILIQAKRDLKLDIYIMEEKAYGEEK